MKTVKTSELTNAALDWAVAKCEGGYNFDATGLPWDVDASNPDDEENGTKWFTPSTDWAQGGPIIERKRITVSPLTLASWRSNVINDDLKSFWQDGPTPLISAMRCYVSSKLGNTIEVPEELL